MSSHLQTPNFTSQQVEEILNNLYGLDASLKKLDGERDLNFLVDNGNSRFVFKIANAEEDASMLECQHRAFDLISARNLFEQPVQAISSVHHNEIEIVHSQDAQTHFCRLVPYIEGSLLSSVNPRSKELYTHLGSTLGNVDKCLVGFHHTGLERELLWDLRSADSVVKRFYPQIKSTEQRGLIDYFNRRFVENVIPVQDNLRQSVIHNDANDNNVIVDEVSQKVICLIDFGDMISSWLAAEPAIAIAYALLEEPDLEQCACAITNGYHQTFELTESEISVMFDLLAARLCMSVTIGAWQQQLQPDNDYLKISEKPAWNLLTRLADVNPDKFTQMLKDSVF